jgi:hypothetical protein
MRKLLLLSLVLGAFVSPGPSAASAVGSSVCMAPVDADGIQRCCKRCKRGKPCGNSCIARNLTCHRGRGCACAG